MRYIPMSLRRAVIERAANRCEYCKLAQAGQEATFHIDHVIPIAAGGKTVLENLALACVSCSLSKSARQIISDPETEAVCMRIESDILELMYKTAIGELKNTEIKMSNKIS